MIGLLAQTVQVSTAGLALAATVLGLVWGLVKLGDRLWLQPRRNGHSGSDRELAAERHRELLDVLRRIESNTQRCGLGSWDSHKGHGQ